MNARQIPEMLKPIEIVFTSQGLLTPFPEEVLVYVISPDYLHKAFTWYGNDPNATIILIGNENNEQ